MERKNVVRKMVPDDVAAIMEIELDSFDEPWSAHAFLDELRYNPRCLYLVVETPQGDLCAYGGIWWGSRGCTLLKLAVAEGFRGSGIASVLLEALIAQAREAGQTAMRLETQKSNGRARRFYEKHGFVETGLIPQFYARTGEDAVVYGLDLKAPAAKGAEAGI